MPLFGKPSFKAARKVPRRRADAGSTNPSQLTDDKVALDPNLNFAQTPLKLSLGGQSMVFQNGQWIATDDVTGVQTFDASEESNALKKKLESVEKENNMLKYKIELLLDMLAASHCDISIMDEEIAQLQRVR